jgi:hypothetical protein
MTEQVKHDILHWYCNQCPDNEDRRCEKMSDCDFYKQLSDKLDAYRNSIVDGVPSAPSLIGMAGSIVLKHWKQEMKGK